MTVYLAGPINGCNDTEAESWRDHAKNILGEENCLDPMRRDYRGKEDQHLSEIVDSDKNDIDESDVVVANCWQVSWGTAMEIFYAHSTGKPVLAIVPAGTKVSPWLRYHALIFHDLFDALDTAASMNWVMSLG